RDSPESAQRSPSVLSVLSGFSDAVARGSVVTIVNSSAAAPTASQRHAGKRGRNRGIAAHGSQCAQPRQEATAPGGQVRAAGAAGQWWATDAARGRCVGVVSA